VGRMGVAVRKIGTITIGQSPRSDMIPEIQAILGSGVEIIEGGALDGLDRAEIERLAPRRGEHVLVTRLRDGSSVQLAEHHILPQMQEQIDRLTAQGAEAIALVCTGEFPPFRSPRLLIEPQKVLHHFVAGVVRGRRLGVVVPLPAQVEGTVKRWGSLGSELRVEAGSPYGDIAELEGACRALRGWGAEMIVLDCMGFSGPMKQRAAELGGVPVVLPRTVLARTLAELI